jgi:hypothetical protein
MHPRTPLLTFCFAMSLSGCSCQWSAGTSYNKSYTTSSGGDRVIVVEDPQGYERERQERIYREREWERQRERDRNREPRVVTEGGRFGTRRQGPHAAPGNTPIQPIAPAPMQPAPTPIQPIPSGSGGSGVPSVGQPMPNNPAPIAQPSPAPTPAAPPPSTGNTGSSGSVGTPAAPPPAAPPRDTYVKPREINRPGGGPAKAGVAGDRVDQSTQKRGPAARRRQGMGRTQ